MVLYSPTKFGILNPWSNIAWPRRFYLGFWPTSNQIYSKLQYREKVFGEFQALPRFPGKMVLNSFTEFGILKSQTNIQSLIRFYLGFCQTSKQIYQKLQCRENVFEELKSLFSFSWKMVLYSSTKFGILKPWTNIQSFRRFDLGLYETSKQIYRKLQYREKLFQEFKSLSRFLRKLLLYSSTKFGILKPWINIPWPRRLHLGFSRTSKQIYRTLQYTDKVFGEFQALPCFPRKIVLYSLTKFAILKPWTNIPWPKRFDLRFWQTSKLIESSNIGRKFLESFKLPLLSQTNSFVFLKQIWHSKGLNHYSMAQQIWFRFWQTSKEIYRKLQ